MTISDQWRRQAAEALRWVVALRQTDQGWAYTDRVMALLRAAVDADDEDAVREAVFELDQICRRVQERLGTESEVAEIPPPQRDRANEMIHEMDPAGDTAEPGK